MSSKDRRRTTIPPYSTPDKASNDEILGMLPDLTFEFSLDGHYIAYHGGPEESLYLPKEQLVGNHYSDILPESAVKKLDQAFEELRRTGRETIARYLLPREDAIRYFEARLLPMKEDRVLGLIRDMTDTWRAKTELEQSESRYRTLVNNLPGVVYRCQIDDDWTAEYMSPRMEEILGYPREDFLSRRLSLCQITHPEDRQYVHREVLAAVAADRPYHLSYRMLDADGEIRQISERGQAVYAEYDEINYLDGVFFDVTEIHHMRQRLLINNKMAAVGNLAAGVAHEINNPLAIAMANLEYVSEEMTAVTAAVTQDSHVQDALGDVSTAVIKIQGGIDRVRSIIDDLRTFSDAAEGRADQLELKRLIEWAIRRSEAYNDEHTEIEIDLETVPLVWASEVGVVQVIWNLLENAMEAAALRDDDDGLIRVFLTHDADQVYITVEDNGPGMPAGVIDRAFEPFFTTKTVGQGAGLGLFVCQGLVDGMDGTIELNSTIGEGTQVTISLPAFQPIYNSKNRD